MASEFRINLPRNNWEGHAADMRSTLETWNWRWQLPPNTSTLTIDFSQVRFIEPWALTMFVAYARSHNASGDVRIKPIIDNRNPSNIYALDMGLIDAIETGKSANQWSESAQNTGLHVIKTHGDVTRFVNSAARLGQGPARDTMDALKYVMAEIGRNVVQHSRSIPGGVAMAQYFPTRNSIQVAIADAGVGVREALQNSYPELRTDLEALKLSILPHVSGAFREGTYSAADNAGLGLFFTKEICWRAGGQFWLGSKEAVLGVRGSDAAANNRVYRKINSWRGTVVALDFPANGVVDFGALLALCRELAAQARKNSGSAGLDFIDGTLDTESIPIVKVDLFLEDVEAAAKVREATILPAIRNGDFIVVDFGGARFVTQSFVHALLHDVLKIPNSLVRLSFMNCTKSTEEAIRAVAAYSATYKTIVD